MALQCFTQPYSEFKKTFGLFLTYPSLDQCHWSCEWYPIPEYHHIQYKQKNQLGLQRQPVSEYPFLQAVHTLLAQKTQLLSTPYVGVTHELPCSTAPSMHCAQEAEVELKTAQFWSIRLQVQGGEESLLRANTYPLSHSTHSTAAEYFRQCSTTSVASTHLLCPAPNGLQPLQHVLQLSELGPANTWQFRSRCTQLPFISAKPQSQLLHFPPVNCRQEEGVEGEVEGEGEGEGGEALLILQLPCDRAQPSQQERQSPVVALKVAQSWLTCRHLRLSAEKQKPLQHLRQTEELPLLWQLGSASTSMTQREEPLLGVLAQPGQQLMQAPVLWLYSLQFSSMPAQAPEALTYILQTHSRQRPVASWLMQQEFLLCCALCTHSTTSELLPRGMARQPKQHCRHCPLALQRLQERLSTSLLPTTLSQMFRQHPPLALSWYPSQQDRHPPELESQVLQRGDTATQRKELSKKQRSTQDLQMPKRNSLQLGSRGEKTHCPKLLNWQEAMQARHPPSSSKIWQFLSTQLPPRISPLSRHCWHCPLPESQTAQKVGRARQAPRGSAQEPLLQSTQREQSSLLTIWQLGSAGMKRQVQLDTRLYPAMQLLHRPDRSAAWQFSGSGTHSCTWSLQAQKGRHMLHPPVPLSKARQFRSWYTQYCRLARMLYPFAHPTQSRLSLKRRQFGSRNLHTPKGFTRQLARQIWQARVTGLAVWQLGSKHCPPTSWKPGWQPLQAEAKATQQGGKGAHTPPRRQKPCLHPRQLRPEAFRQKPSAIDWQLPFTRSYPAEQKVQPPLPKSTSWQLPSPAEPLAQSGWLASRNSGREQLPGRAVRLAMRAKGRQLPKYTPYPCLQYLQVALPADYSARQQLRLAATQAAGRQEVPSSTLEELHCVHSPVFLSRKAQLLLWQLHLPFFSTYLGWQAVQAPCELIAMQFRYWMEQLPEGESTAPGRHCRQVPRKTRQPAKVRWQEFQMGSKVGLQARQLREESYLPQLGSVLSASHPPPSTGLKPSLQAKHTLSLDPLSRQQAQFWSQPLLRCSSASRKRGRNMEPRNQQSQQSSRNTP